MLVMNNKISIIVPVYNAERYLSRCIESILAQTYTEFELLLIDDGSKDDSGEICDEYAKKDSRIQVIHKENGGVSSARNAGIDKAKGDWVAFVDADDYIESCYIQNLYSHVFCERQLILTGYDSKFKICRFEEISLTDDNFVKYLIDNKAILHSQPWAKLFNLNVIKQSEIYFPLDIHLGEDAIFNLRYYSVVDMVTFAKDVDYHYEVGNEKSLIRRINSFDSEWNAYVIWKDRLLGLLTRFPLYENPVKEAWNNGLGGQFQRCLRSIYDKRNGYCMKKQIGLLKSIPEEDCHQYCNYYGGNSKKHELNQFFLSNRLYMLFYFFNKMYKNNR